MSPQARHRALRAAAAVAAISIAGCAAHRPKAPPVPVPQAQDPQPTPTDAAATASPGECQTQIDAHQAPLPDSDLACCQQLVEAVSNDPNAQSPWQELESCCRLMDAHDDKACTPWGPPVPPAFRPREA